MMRTCTVAARFSHTRGGEKMRCGPISRMSCCTVSGSSGKFTVKPKSSAEATAIICSPIQARGRKDTNSSPGRLGSAWPRFQAMESMLRCESMASLGRPVVPEVVAMRQGSSGRTSATQAANSPARARPMSRTASKLASPGSWQPARPLGSW